MKVINSFERLGLLSRLEMLEVNSLPLRWVPFVNVLTLGFGLFLLSSKWLCPPGIQMDLPTISSGVAYQSVIPMEDTLIVDRQSRVFFNRRFYDFNQLGHLFDTKESGTERLILQIDENVNLKNILKIVEQAKISGYKSITIAVVNL